VEKVFDVAIAGLGAMGSAAAWHLSRSGAKVVGFDRFHPPHSQGSSHGETRIIREAYFEHPSYVPLVQRAYELWQELEDASGQQLLLQTGGLMIGPRDGALLSGTLRSAREHSLAHTVLSPEELKATFPGFRPRAGMAAIREGRAGVLFPELSIKTQLGLAAKAGAEFHFEEPVSAWETGAGSVRLVTPRGTYRARKLLLCAGAWMGSLLGELGLPLRVERQVMFWFEPRAQPENFRPPAFPIFICEYGEQRFFYALPDVGNGVKVAFHHEGERTEPESVKREVERAEVGKMRSLLATFLPALDGEPRRCEVCLYTDTPDEHFIVDWHPRHPEVLIVSACSGHGFKFSPVVGECAALLLRGEPPRLSLDLFSIGREKLRAENGPIR
jgi:sarcosine oxidase